MPDQKKIKVLKECLEEIINTPVDTNFAVVQVLDIQVKARVALGEIKEIK